MSDPGGETTREGERCPSPAGGLAYLQLDPPLPGAAQPIADGILWLRIPLPMELNHINVWLLEDGDGWLLVDTGMAEDVCRDTWLLLEQEVLGGRPLKRILVTHDHPDHVGLAPWLAERHGSALWMSAHAHRSSAEFLATPPEALGARIRRFLELHGVEIPAGVSLTRGDPRKWFGDLPPLACAPADRDFICAGGAQWQVVETAGHCRGHLCLYDAGRRLLVSGDQVLPSISPNVSVLSSAPDANPLGEFLASLDRLGACHPDTLVLPSHGRPFRGLHRRLAELAGHHREQLDALRGFCVEPRTAFETLHVLFRRVPRGFHRLLAVGEAVAHLNYLDRCGLMERRCDDGVARFVTVAAPPSG